MTTSSRRKAWLPLIAALVMAFAGAMRSATVCAEDPPAAAPADKPAANSNTKPAEAPSANATLSVEQARLADRYKELERVILRMAEVMKSTDPKRAALLQQAFTQSKERQINLQFEDVVKLLEKEQLYQANKGQLAVQQDLNRLLQLLLSGEREKQIADERLEIKKFIERINKLIREQQGIQGETEGQGETAGLTKRQGTVAEKTAQLSGDVKKFEDRNEPANREEPSADKDDKKSDDKGGAKAKDNANGKPDDKNAGGKSDENNGQKKNGEKADSKPEEKSAEKSDEKSSGKSNGKSGEKSDGSPKSADGKSEQEQKSGKSKSPSNGKQGQPSTPGESQEGKQSDDQQDKPGENDESQGRKRIRQAEERMRDARRRLDEANRKGAAEEQEKAVEKLKEAKAELEEILRQLREEEIERVLAMLEGRFRKMLEMQNEINEGTLRMDRVAEDERDHDLEIESGKLSRKEALVTAEADKALGLLHDEGSSVAFPETVEQMREDMNQVTGRLARANVGQITQGIEQDIVKSLEEMIAALQKAQKEQQQRQGGKGGGGGGGDQPLVDQIAELKMIRALQMRVNNRTGRYSKLLQEGAEQAQEPDLVEALKRLGEREERIYRTTRDIVVGKNR